MEIPDPSLQGGRVVHAARIVRRRPDQVVRQRDRVGALATHGVEGGVVRSWVEGAVVEGGLMVVRVARDGGRGAATSCRRRRCGEMGWVSVRGLPSSQLQQKMLHSP